MKKTKAIVPAEIVKRELAQVAPARPASNALTGFISKNTKRAYERDLKDFFRVDDLKTISIEQIIAVTPEQVTEFRDRMVAEDKSSATICRKLSALRSLYSQLFARGAVQRNPADPRLVRSPKRSTVRRTSPLTAKELRRLLAAPDKSTEIGLRDHAMLLLASQAGLRREELCTMQDGNLARYGARWCVTFKGKGGKERRVPLHDSVVEAINGWRKVRPRNAETLFSAMDGARYNEGTFYKAVTKYAKLAGFDPEEKRVHPHSLRAAFATILYEDGVPIKEIQELMGHARIETTMGYIKDADLSKSKAPDVMARAIEEPDERD